MLHLPNSAPSHHTSRDTTQHNGIVMLLAHLQQLGTASCLPPSHNTTLQCMALEQGTRAVQPVFVTTMDTQRLGCERTMVCNVEARGCYNGSSSRALARSSHPACVRRYQPNRQPAQHHPTESGNACTGACNTQCAAGPFPCKGTKRETATACSLQELDVHSAHILAANTGSAKLAKPSAASNNLAATHAATHTGSTKGWEKL
jgi:hypothetical protein